MQLGIALYYGEIGNFKDGETEDSTCHNKDMLGNVTGKYNKIFITVVLTKVFSPLWNLKSYNSRLCFTVFWYDGMICLTLIFFFSTFCILLSLSFFYMLQITWLFL